METDTKPAVRARREDINTQDYTLITPDVTLRAKYTHRPENSYTFEKLEVRLSGDRFGVTVTRRNDDETSVVENYKTEDLPPWSKVKKLRDLAPEVKESILERKELSQEARSLLAKALE